MTKLYTNIMLNYATTQKVILVYVIAYDIFIEYRKILAILISFSAELIRVWQVKQSEDVKAL